MNNYIFLLTLCMMQGISFWIGKRTGKKLASKDEYFFSGKTLSFFPLTMTLIATQVGGALILGASEEAYGRGLVALLYPLGLALGLIVFGCGPGKKLSTFSFLTISELFEAKYSSVLLKKIASVLSVVTLFLILTAQVIASKKFLITLGFTNPFWLIVFWGVLIFYTSSGGFRAVVRTDIVQAAFLIIILLLCGFLVFRNYPSHLCDPSLFKLDKMISYKSVLVWFFSPFMFLFIEQDMAQRCFSAKSPKIFKKASIISGSSVLLLSIIPVILGIFLKRNCVTVSPNQSVFMIAVQLFTNPYFSGFVGCAVLIAIMSTADSLINSICSMIVHDFVNIKKTSLSHIKIISFFIAIAATVTACFFKSIISLVVFSYGLSVSCLLIPILMSLVFRYSFSFLSAFFSMIFGGATFLIISGGYFSGILLPHDIFSVLVSFLGFVLGEFVYVLNRRIFSLGKNK